MTPKHVVIRWISRKVVPPTPGQANKKPMHIPILVGLVNDNGDDMDLGGWRDNEAA
jgi:hypothetical protein